LNSGRGSRPGFSSSLRMSCTVGRPKRSSVYFARVELRRAAGVADQRAIHPCRCRRGCARPPGRLPGAPPSIERVVAVADAQEAGGLLEGLVAEARHVLQQPCAEGKAPCVAVGTMFAGQRGVEAGDAGEQGAEAVFTSTPTAFTQSSTTASSARARRGLVDVVLVLADADRLGIDLDQFGQRVLQAAGDRHGAAQD
jgi:hypothetical protein